MSDFARDRRILAISSLPAVGSAGLKNIIGVLGTRVIPVPSLFISGLGNMPGHKRFQVPFEEMLRSVFEMCEKQGFELVLYTGYLQSESQVDDILKLSAAYRPMIEAVVVDPVCGDQGRPYVSEAIIDKLRMLLDIADVAIPNRTELALVQGQEVTTDLAALIDHFSRRYEGVELVTTGVIFEQEIGNYVTIAGRTHVVRHPMQVDRLLSGTGDLFAAFYIYFRYLKHMESLDSVQAAGERIISLIANDKDPIHRPEELQFDLHSATSDLFPS